MRVAASRTKQSAEVPAFCYLKNAGAVAYLDKKGRELLEQKGHSRVLAYRRGQAVEFPLESKVYIIQEGQVFLSCLDPSGRKIILDTLEEGDVFGDLGLQPNLQSQDCLFVEPDKKAVICEVPRGLFSKLIETQPEFATQLISFLSAKIRQLSEQVGTLLFADARTKLLLLLARLAQRGREEKGLTTIPQKITHQQLADMIGVHRETVSVLISELVREGIIGYNSRHFFQISKQKAASQLTA